MPAGIERHRFDVEEYHRMLEAGVLSEDDRVELIGGEIADMTPVGWRHVECVNRLTMLLAAFAAGKGYTGSVQNPLRLAGDAEPQPDPALIKERPRRDLPTPEDVVLAVEVAETSLAYDRDIKLPLYARAGIPEARVVDLRNRKLEIGIDPASSGYRVFRPGGPSEQLNSETVEGLSLSVDEVLG